jgi:hypothetical protein
LTTKTKKPVQAEFSSEEITKIETFTLAREKDSDSKDFEKCIKNLQKQFGCDLEKEVFEIDEL